MTTTDLARLLAADLSDAATRLVAADALEDAGRSDEAAILRDLTTQAGVRADGTVVRWSPLEDVRAAYEAAKGCWTGLDWPAYSGPSGASYLPDDEGYCVGLEGMSADDCDRQAAGWAALAKLDLTPLASTSEDASASDLRDALAEKMDLEGGDGVTLTEEMCERLASWWKAGAELVREIESDAEEAEEVAAEAMEAAEAGRWDDALEAAERACRIERQHGDCPTWGGFRSAIEDAMAASAAEEN